MRLVISIAWLACSAVLLPTTASAACDAVTVRSGPQTIAAGGFTRSFVLRMPPGADGRAPAPVVFAFHPFGMSSQYMQSRAPVARSWPEAVVVYPDAAAPSRAWQTTAPSDGNADLQFFDAMLAWLDTHGCIDRAQVFVLGYSNGAQFAHRLACDRAGTIAGIAAAAGRLTCAPATAVPVIISHGLADRTAPYRLAAEASDAWAERNACAAPPAAGATGCSVATGCSEAGTVLCTHAGGHEYDPSFTARAVEFFRNGR